MNHSEQPDVIRAHMLEVLRTQQRLPEGPERDALDTYRDQLAALGHATPQPPTPIISPSAQAPTLAPRPPAAALNSDPAICGSARRRP